MSVIEKGQLIEACKPGLDVAFFEQLGGIDVDNDGTISLEEYLGFMEAQHIEMGGEAGGAGDQWFHKTAHILTKNLEDWKLAVRATEVFEFVAAQTGIASEMTKEELVAAYRVEHSWDRTPEELFQKIDVNNNNVIQLPEWLEWLEETADAKCGATGKASPPLTLTPHPHPSPNPSPEP